MSPENRPRTAKWRGPMFFYVMAAAMLLMAAIGLVRGTEWYLNLLLAAGGFMALLVLGRPTLRVAVYRTGTQEIVCRCIPWYQANTLATAVTFPIIGIAALVMGRAPDSPAWVRVGGYFILALGALAFVFAALQSTNRLSFTPSLLTVRIGRRFDITRDRVIAIKPRTLTSTGTGQTSDHIDLVYVPVNGGGNRIMMCLDMQFSIQVANLAAALEAWKDADPADPGLSDRIEATLRGQTPTSA